MKLWPWSELAVLRREVRAARNSCSANAKRGNRLAARILMLDKAAQKHHAQAKHDQEYIDALEALVSKKAVARIREQMATSTTSASGATEKAPVRAGGVTGQGEKGSSEADRVGRSAGDA